MGATPLLHLIDSLNLGGAERMVVNIANALPKDLFESHLCTTRQEGLLSKEISPHIKRVALNRKKRFAILPLLYLAQYIRKNKIRLIHAHGTTLFVAVMMKLSNPRIKIIWHVHSGAYATNRIPAIYNLAIYFVETTVVVNTPLLKWARETANIAPDKTEYIPNFVDMPSNTTEMINLSKNGGRIVCVANLRPEKGHLNLLKAMEIVSRSTQQYLLILVTGKAIDIDYRMTVLQEIVKRRLEDNISILVERNDVTDILSMSDIGVLSSVSEGLPLALLEYGAAGLATIATDVGQCREVLDNGRVGILVQAGEPEQLADAIIDLLNSPEKRSRLGTAFKEHIQNNYSKEKTVEKLCFIYERCLDRRN